MRILFFLLLVVMAFSCKTVKEVVKIETRIDSTASQEAARLAELLKTEKIKHEKEKEQWENTGVVFVTEDCPDSSKLSPPAKIIFDNGKIKSIEGRVKSLNQSLYEKSSELSEAHSTIDSLGIELEKKEVELSKNEKALVKDITRTTTPWWLFGLLIVAGWLGRGYWPRVKTFIIKKGL